MDGNKRGKVRGIYLPGDLWEWLAEASPRQNRSVSNLVALLVRKAMDDEASHADGR